MSRSSLPALAYTRIGVPAGIKKPFRAGLTAFPGTSKKKGAGHGCRPCNQRNT